MTLRLQNTLTGNKDDFIPLDPDRITLYVCGPTVYNFVHIGNARPVVVFDVLYRLLQRLYPNVVYARNITDIDDKIIKAAAENGEDISALTERFTAAFAEDMASLNAKTPNIIPKATDHIPEMIQMIATLVEKGHAYEADGQVLFAVESMPDYGKLSGRKLEDMLAGARVEVADYKRHPGDFILWKPSTDEQPGWDSPWGRGRPGWHIECSAMIHKHLGDVIDIHGGGQDLIFPHHENEIAQGCCAHGTDYVRYWLHNGYINIDGEKMSKSLGNFRLVRDLLTHYHGEILRFALLSSHYRSPLNFSEETLTEAEKNLDYFYGALREVENVDISGIEYDVKQSPVFNALLDDLNTREAITEMHLYAHGIHTSSDEADRRGYKARLLASADLLGLLTVEPTAWFQNKNVSDDGLSNDDIDALVAERTQAKKDKNFARADEIRQQLTDAGIQLEDTREGTRWSR